MEFSMGEIKYKTDLQNPKNSITKKLCLPQLSYLRNNNVDTEKGFSLHPLIESSYKFDPEDNKILHPPNQNWIVWSSFGPKELGTFDFETKLSEKGNIPIPNSNLKGEISYFPYGMFPSDEAANKWLEKFYQQNPNAIYWNIQITDASELPIPITLEKWQYDETQWIKQYNDTMKMNHEQIYKDSLKMQQSKSDVISKIKKTNQILKLINEEDTKIQKQEFQKRNQEQLNFHNQLLNRKDIEIQNFKKIEIPVSKSIKSLFPSLFDAYIEYDSLLQPETNPYSYVIIRSEHDSCMYLARKYL